MVEREEGKRGWGEEEGMRKLYTHYKCRELGEEDSRDKLADERLREMVRGGEGGRRQRAGGERGGGKEGKKGRKGRGVGERGGGERGG